MHPDHRSRPSPRRRRAWRLVPLLLVGVAALAWGVVRPFVHGATLAAEPPVHAPVPSSPARAGMRKAPVPVASVAPAPIRVSEAIAAMPELTLTVVNPCRIADTRVAGGRLADDGLRAFTVTTADYRHQGGEYWGCELDATTPVAVLLNVTVVMPARAGYATLYAPDESRPLAASINYAAGAVVNNTVAVKVDAGAEGRPFALYSYAGADYVIDIVGYYTPRVDTQARMECFNAQTERFAPSGYEFFYIAPPQCEAGFTAVSSHCQWYGSTVPDQPNPTIDWEINGLYNVDYGGAGFQMRTVCDGFEKLPAASGGGSLVMVFDRCCRVVEDVVAPKARP